MCEHCTALIDDGWKKVCSSRSGLMTPKIQRKSCPDCKEKGFFVVYERSMGYKPLPKKKKAKKKRGRKKNSDSK